MGVRSAVKACKGLPGCVANGASLGWKIRGDDATTALGILRCAYAGCSSRHICMYVCTHIDGEHMKREFGVCSECGSPTVAIGGKWHMRM